MIEADAINILIDVEYSTEKVGRYFLCGERQFYENCFD